MNREIADRMAAAWARSDQVTALQRDIQHALDAALHRRGWEAPHDEALVRAAIRLTELERDAITGELDAIGRLLGIDR